MKRITRISNLEQIKLALMNSKCSCFIAPVSYEDRCMASVSIMEKQGIQLSKGLLLSYETSADLFEEAEKKRTQHRAIFLSKVKAFIREIQEIHLKPYVFNDIQIHLNKYLQHVDLIVIDISCLTIIHTLAIAAFIAELNQDVAIFIVYSEPENYGSFNAKRHDLPFWKDLIIAPFGERALYRYEREGRGIIIPGFESDRLIFALEEIEPPAGIAMLVSSPHRPDWKKVTQENNKKTLGLLKRKGWGIDTFSLFDFSRFESCVSEQIELTKQPLYSAPVFLFPYGPKVVILSVALSLAQKYSESSWFICPIPDSYDVNYSIGIGRTSWIKLEVAI